MKGFKVIKWYLEARKLKSSRKKCDRVRKVLSFGSNLENNSIERPDKEINL